MSSLVNPPSLIGPVLGALLSIAVSILTAATVVLTVKSKGSLLSLSFPAGSVCVTSSECGPSVNGVVGVYVHVPSGFTVVVPRG